jgi:hypothetical protein
MKRYDRDGQAVIPIDAWSPLLDDLGLDPESDLANTLADFMQGVGEGYISYEPLLEVVGGMPMPSPGMATGSQASPTRHREQTPPRGGQTPPHRGLTPRDRDSDTPVGAPIPRGEQTTPRGELTPRGNARPSAAYHEGGSSPPSPNGPQGLGAPLDPADLEDAETFWGRRGAIVQRLYQQWDCNQLSNEQFTLQLQELLGARVDVTHHDSVFSRLVNKHRTARSMKFAELTSALRHDARTTAFRRFGHGSAPSSYAGSYAPSYAGSVYEAAPSEAGGSEAPWGLQPGTAAGRRTGQPPPNTLGSAGRRHYHTLDRAELQRGAAPIPSDCGSEHRPMPRKGRPPSGYGESLPDSDSASAAGMRPGGYAGGVAQGGYPGVRGVLPGPGDHPDRRAPDRGSGLRVGNDYWDQRGPSRREEQCDVMSQVESVADSQFSHHQHRNRHGHGNILTWGKDESRTITPERKRGGRQLAMDDGKGVLRSQVTAGVFPQRH